MPDSSSGNYSLPPGYLAVTGQTISASQHNPPMEDLAAAMSRRMMRDGRAPMLGNLQMNGYRATGAAAAVDGSDYVTLAQVQAMVLGLGFYPGFQTAYTISSTSVPQGWLAANGQSVLRATYPALWAAVQSGDNLAATEGAKTLGQYGPGNGSTTFTLPNLYADGGYFIRPMASGRGIGSVQGDELRSHGHGGSVDPAGGHSHGGVLRPGNGAAGDAGSSLNRGTPGSTDGVGDHTHGLNITATGGAETRPKNIAYPVLIKV